MTPARERPAGRRSGELARATPVSRAWFTSGSCSFCRSGGAPASPTSSIASSSPRRPNQGYERGRLYTPAAHERARRFYERRGWRSLGEQLNPELGLALAEYRIDLYLCSFAGSRFIADRSLLATAAFVIGVRHAEKEEAMTPNALMERTLQSALEDELELTSHGRCVAVVSMQIAAELGFDTDAQRQIGLAGALHDVGKRLIDPAILDKPGPLDEGEWDEIHRHPALGESILADAGLGDIAPWVRSHHERPDGRGYPDGLRRRQIPVEAAILAVADAWDAMLTDRCYGERLTPEEALDELRRCAGSQFSRQVVSAALRCELDVSDGAGARDSIDE